MKKFTLALFLSLIFFMAFWGNGMAAIPGSGWWSAFRVQNISQKEPPEEATGSLSILAYNRLDLSDPISGGPFIFDRDKALVYDPGKTVNYPAGNIVGFDNPLPPGFEGSVVLTSNVPAASVSQLANFSNGVVGGTGKASAMYPGISAEMASTEALVPTIKHNYVGSTTTLYIQAAGAEAEVTVDYTMADGGTYSQTETIQPNRSFLFDPMNAGVPYENCGYDTMTSPCYGSAIITATSKIAGVLIEHPHSGTPVTFVQAMRLSTPNDESQIIYVPSVKNEFCGSDGCGTAGAAVMNVGDLDAEVTIKLTVTKLGNNAPNSVAKGDVYTASAIIPAGENYLFSKWNNNLGGLPKGTMAAAVIESTNGQPLVGSSNDEKSQQGFPGLAKVKYSAFPDELATPIAYAPMVKEFLGIFTGGVTVQNVGNNPDYINIEYHVYGSEEVCILRTINEVPVGGAAETNWVSRVGDVQFTLSGDCDSFGWLAGKEYSVKAYTDAGEDIVVMVTENTPNRTLDISRYEGINVNVGGDA